MKQEFYGRISGCQVLRGIARYCQVGRYCKDKPATKCMRVPGMGVPRCLAFAHQLLLQTLKCKFRKTFIAKFAVKAISIDKEKFGRASSLALQTIFAYLSDVLSLKVIL